MAEFQIPEYFQKLPHVPANNLVWNEIILCQDEIFFRLAHEKQLRADKLRRLFDGRRSLRLFITDKNLAHLGCRLPGVTVERLPKDFLMHCSPPELAAKRARVAGGVVLVTNGDVQEPANRDGYIQLFAECEETIFIAWDWDNHHGLIFSTMLAAHSDVYAPAHRENQYLLSRFNPVMIEAACGVSQWAHAFLRQRESDLMRGPRSDEPLGRHVMYAPFRYRNGLIATLHGYFPQVGFSEKYGQRSPEERFAEWAGHKVHLIAPVLNDLPIRTFDALVSGGIPLIPQSLMFSEWLADAHPDDVLAYSARDLMNPRPLVERACRLFDAGGAAGVLRRYEYALSRHHGDERIATLLRRTTPLFGCALG